MEKEELEYDEFFYDISRNINITFNGRLRYESLKTLYKMKADAEKISNINCWYITYHLKETIIYMIDLEIEEKEKEGMKIMHGL